MSEASIPGRDLEAELTALEDRFGTDIGAVLARSEQIELAAAAIPDEALRVRARLLQANMHRRAGDLARAARMCWEANSWADQQGHRPLLSRRHQLLSAIYDNLGDTATGLEHALHAVEFLDDDTPPKLRAVMLVKLADDLAMAGSLDDARERYRQAEQLALSLADTATLVVVLNNFAYAEYIGGDVERAWATMDRLRAATERTGRRLSPDAVDTLARIQIAMGRHADAAKTACDNVLAQAMSGGDDIDSMAEFLLTLAVAQRHQGDTAAAQASLDGCAALCRERDLAGIGVRVVQEQAELHAARGEFARAFEAHKEYHAAEHRLISQQRAAQARTRHAMFETAEGAARGRAVPGAGPAGSADGPAQPPVRRRAAAGAAGADVGRRGDGRPGPLQADQRRVLAPDRRPGAGRGRRAAAGGGRAGLRGPAPRRGVPGRAGRRGRGRGAAAARGAAPHGGGAELGAADR